MTMTLDDLRNNLDGPSEEYRRKQLHPVPDAKVVDREAFILERVAGKVVLDIGASGRMHEAIVMAAAFTWGITRPPENDPYVVRYTDVIESRMQGRFDIRYLDIDQHDAHWPHFKDVEIVICGEVIEHLSNPGQFLQKLRAYRCPVIITVPNAHGDVGRAWLEKGFNCVNIDHVAWYCERTLKTLLTRAGYEVKEHYWYNGRPRFAEGLIFVVE
jgi:hypothetical protein